MGVTFKKEPRNTGLMAVGNPYKNVIVKVDKKECGYIYAPNWHRDGWRIQIAVEKVKMGDGENCPWGWLQYGTYPTEQHARAAAKDAIAELLRDGCTIHRFDDD